MHTSRPAARLAALRVTGIALLLAGAGPAAAQTIGIASPGHGDLLLDTSGFYRGAPYYDVEVRGVADIPKGKKSQYALYVHGRRVSIGSGFFQERVWIGPWAGPGGPPPPWYPYLAFLTDPQHIQRPIVVELVENATKAVFYGRLD